MSFFPGAEHSDREPDADAENAEAEEYFESLKRCE